MAHDHSHAHGHVHVHGDSRDARRRVALAAGLTFAFMLAEVAGGLISGSLALLADAAHMLTDAGALALAWVGFRLAERPADASRSYGFHRVKVLAAFVNGLSLVVLAAWIVWEAVERLLSPGEVLGGVMLVIAIAGLLVNIIAFAILHGGDLEDLNLRGALWHVAGDLLGSVAAIIAAGVILWTGWSAIDPILSVLVALLVAVGGVRLVREAGHILLEGTPSGLEVEAIREGLLANVSGIDRVEHMHVWSLNEARPLITLDVYAAAGACPETLRRAVKAHLKSAHDIDHATVEVIAEPRSL
ncbi:MAG: cation diffusion facilitator family transporter [Hyphomonadaceae bacterium]|nr:cation diffusion facilitator family transporter [Hyphomonadaceae bacterium]